MDKMLTCKETADLWNFTERWVSIMCKEGKIPGAKKEGHRWYIPANAQKPVDNRIKSGAYRKEGTPSSLPLPAGVSDYRKACTEYFYIDKTSFIKEFLDQRPPVSLFLRPQKFGKSLMMDMLRVYFEKTGEDTSRYFQNRRIWAMGEAYRRHQGIYPVIFLSFKDLKYDNWSNSFRKFTELIQREFLRHSVLGLSDKLSSYEKEMYEKIAVRDADEVEISSSLFTLCRMLSAHYGREPVVIIDDYDIPILYSKRYQYFDRLIFFLQNLFSGVFKDNPYLSFGILCGTHKFPSESMFRETIAPRVFSFTDNAFQDSFGFTEDEVLQMAAYCGVDVNIDQLRGWYGGYSAGMQSILNPWSVVNCLANGGQTQDYWKPADSAEIFRSVFDNISYGSMEHLRALLSDQSIRTQLRPDCPDPGSPKTLAEAYSILVDEGYLHITGQETRPSGVIIYDVEFPNTEASLACRRELLSYLQEAETIAKAPALQLQDAIYSRSLPKFQVALKQLLYQSIRNHRLTGDDYSQSLITGLAMLTEECYSVEEGASAGENYELHMLPKLEPFPEIKIEIKAGKTVKLLYSR